MGPFQPPESRDECVFMAKLCEQAERYDEMVVCMKKIVKQNPELSVEERNLLAVAYKQIISTRRTSWRIVYSIEQKEESKGNMEHVKLITNYRKLFEKELGDICEDVCNTLDQQLLPAAKAGEDQVFYYKMKGDYYRYWSEVNSSEQQQDLALEAYQKAMDVAARLLPTTHPIRLGLVLNAAVFYYEIVRQPDKGIDLAKKAFDSAVTELESLDEDSYKESTLIMQLLRDNLTLWAEDGKDANKDDDD
eukprot:TRINITY_DN13116_c0_g2_i1.p1 TRINITY_DN13116_c0_g2~~TRINITY_DN13116_c0_g2_i1.p1  ORF type:complete len:276 (+),score=123.36 TRINITY_DN13116_c0_g2_i1:86-829(+)